MIFDAVIFVPAKCKNKIKMARFNPSDESKKRTAQKTDDALTLKRVFKRYWCGALGFFSIGR